MTKKIVLILLVILLVTGYFAMGLHRYLNLSYLKESRGLLMDILQEHPLRFMGLFCVMYLFIVSLNIPGAVVLGLAAGYLFGFAAGTVIISFVSSIGATAACLLSRYLFRDFIRIRFPRAIERINSGIDNDGGYYLFSLRLIPVMPFFLINAGMGLTRMPLWKFYLISQAGMLPGTMVFINAGKELGKIDSLSGILTPGLMASFVLMGLAPLVLKKIHGLFRERHMNRSEAATESGQ